MGKQWTAAMKRQHSRRMKAAYRQKGVKKAEQHAVALFAGKIHRAPMPTGSAEPTLRVSQMAEFVVALVDAARGRKPQ